GAVDGPGLESFLARVDAPLRAGVDLVLALAARAGDLLQKILVRLFDLRLQRSALVLGERPRDGEQACVLASGDQRAAHAEPFEQPRQLELAAKHSNRPGNRIGRRPNLVGAQGCHVPSPGADSTQITTPRLFLPLT